MANQNFGKSVAMSVKYVARVAAAMPPDVRRGPARYLGNLERYDRMPLHESSYSSGAPSGAAADLHQERRNRGGGVTAVVVAGIVAAVAAMAAWTVTLGDFVAGIVAALIAGAFVFGLAKRGPSESKDRDSTDEIGAYVRRIHYWARFAGVMVAAGVIAGGLVVVGAAAEP